MTADTPAAGAAPATGARRRLPGRERLAALWATVRPFWILALFVAGIVLGAVGFGRMATGFEYGPYPPRSEAAEPVPADRMTDLIVAGDDEALADAFEPELISQLATALQPFDRITDIRYLGTVAQGDESLASYVVLGRVGSGLDAAMPFAVRVRDGEVVGVN